MASEKILNGKKEIVAEIKENIEKSKNTLTRIALKDMGIALDEETINGPIAMCYSTDIVSPIKVIADYAKDHPELQMQIGIVDGEISEKEKLQKLATIPSRDTLLTMLAGGMIGIVRDLSICLDMYSKQKEEN